MKNLKTILLIFAVIAVCIDTIAQTCDGTSISIDENDFPQTCISTAADDGINTTETFMVDGDGDMTNDIMVTMTATCAPAANDGDGNVSTVAACLGPDGLNTNIGMPNTDPFTLNAAGGSDIGYVSINDDPCASCIVEICYDFINGFESDAAGLDIDWSSMNGGTEGQESWMGWIEGTNNTSGAAITGYNSGTLIDGSYCYAQTSQGTTAAQHLTGVGAGGALPSGVYGADEITGNADAGMPGDGTATSCGDDWGEGAGEPRNNDSGPNSTVSTGQGDGVIQPNWGFGTDDITVTRLCMVYFGSNNNSEDCGADDVSEVNTAPSGSFSSVDFCIPPVEVECGVCTEGAAGLVITELSYDPSGAQGNDGDCEYIELFNSYSTPIVIDMNTTVTLSGGTTVNLPAGTTIAPGEYIILTGPNFAGCMFANPPPAGTQIIDVGVPGTLGNGGEDVVITLACAEDPAAGNTQMVTWSDATTPNAGGGGQSVYYPLDGTGPLEGAPTPGSGDCVACTSTPYVCAMVACAIEADLMTAPPAPTVTESTCQADGTTVDGGVVDPITCPTDATAEYSIDGGTTWSTTVPMYDQTNSITVTVRCLCDEDMTTASPTAEVVTMPGVCTSTCAIEADLMTAPTAPVIVESTCQADGTTVDGGSIAAITCPANSTAEYSIDGGTTWTTTVPAYNQTTAVTVSVRCLCDEDMSTASPVTTVATAPGACACDISNVVFTQACTNSGEAYELCVTFDYSGIGASGMFNIYLDPAGTGTPTTIVAGPYAYSAYDAAIAGGATCFTIPAADYAGDATDLEMGIELCVADADAPAPGTGLPPGTVPMGGGLPNPDCTSIIGIFANACGANEGQNEFVVLQNGNTGITGNDIVIDTPANDDYDMWESAATTAANIATAGWICPCCVAIDGSSAIPANAVVIVTGNMLDQPYDFTGLCTAAGTVYVLGESSTGTGGHFSNGGGRSTVLNVTNAGAGCTYPQSYTYLTSDLIAGGDGDYIAFSGPDNPTQTAGNNDDPAGTNGTGSNNGCTGPEVVVEAEVECFGCTTLNETTCIISAECPATAPVDAADPICDGSLAAEIATWQTSVEADATNTTAIADANTDAAVIYSTDAPAAVAEATPPTAGTATGVHSGADLCVSEDQLTYAYLLCYGVDGAAGGGDDIYFLLGTHTLTVNPLPQEPTIMVTQGDPECTYIVVGVCGDETVGALMNEACGTDAPADEIVTVTTAANCEADFTVSKPACEACGAVCEISGLTATPVCNDDGTYCLTVDLTVTTPGASGQYTLDINGATFGPYNYADLPQAMICDPTFIGDGETGISITATDADNTGGGGTGGLYVSSVLADPNMADGNGSGTVDSCDEYIELTNSSANPIDVSGYEIWDDASGGTPRYTIPAGTIIPPGGTLIIYTSDIAGMADGCTGVWNNGGDVIYVYSDSGVTLIDSQTYTGSADDEIIIFADPNGGGGMACSAVATFDELDCATAMCPVAASASTGISVCSGDPITALADWQDAVDAANPLDTTQDPDGLGTIEYSSTPDDMSGTWMPDGDVSGITGVHTGINGPDVCVTEDQIVYAYLLCSDDNSYQVIGSLTVTVYPLIADAVTVNNDGGCCPSVTVACPDYLVSNDYDGNEAIPDCSAEDMTGNITFNIELAVDPIGGACLSYEVLGAYDCSVPVCQITPAMATNILCDDNGTPSDPSDDTYTFDITVNGSSNFPGATNTFSDDQGNTGLAYGSTVSYGPFPIAGGNITVNFTDTEQQADCTGMMMAIAPDTCSDEMVEITISDPCSCSSPNNIDLDNDGVVDFVADIITITGPTGDTWCITNNQTPTALDATGMDLLADGSICAVEGPNGIYTLTVYHPADGTGFGPLTFSSDAGLADQDISNDGTGCNCQECSIAPDMATSIVCDDNGTPADPSDDTFTFDIAVNGSNTFPGVTNTFNDDQGNAGIAYGTIISYGPFPIAGGNITVVFTDTDDMTCTGMMMAVAPAPCSTDVVCEDEISGTVFTPPGCDAGGIEVTVFDDMGNVVVTFTTDANGVYDSTPTVYPCGSYTVGLTDNIPQCYIDASGEVDPKPFVIDGDDDDTDTDGQNFMPNAIPTLSQWGLICLALLLMVYGALMIGAKSIAFENLRK